MSYQVFLTRDAVRDLEELDEHLTTSDSAEKADFFLDKIETVLQRLSESPERGNRPRELLALGLGDYSQVFFKPYRIIYTIRHKDIYVLLIADGRRDMETLLQSRLLAF
ncbi:type II toxin-antitoxin system RelE/ParE family toxin [bacterium]|nr:type II toxin-antitoxin system RelE/ParE family toxin [bacterium]